mmetsp:Transcript_30826/g.101188  ORF Transcript_30826/g.101188 Transcript_30826/m.101188 type:complete len:253 (-) Transcript_30826:1139-1897(-)
MMRLLNSNCFLDLTAFSFASSPTGSSWMKAASMPMRTASQRNSQRLNETEGSSGISLKWMAAEGPARSRPASLMTEQRSKCMCECARIVKPRVVGPDAKVHRTARTRPSLKHAQGLQSSVSGVSPLGSTRTRRPSRSRKTFDVTQSAQWSLTMEPFGVPTIFSVASRESVCTCGVSPTVKPQWRAVALSFSLLHAGSITRRSHSLSTTSTEPDPAESMMSWTHSKMFDHTPWKSPRFANFSDATAASSSVTT